jgi:hypothetical protein
MRARCARGGSWPNMSSTRRLVSHGIATFPATRPRRNMVTVSHSSCTSSSLCETKKMTLPCSAIVRRAVNSFPRCGAEIADVGSSRMRTLAPSQRRRRISSCWRSPTVRLAQEASGSSANANWAASAPSDSRASRRSWTQPPGLPRRKLSRTPSCGKSSGSWWSIPIPRRIASAGDVIWTEAPLIRTWPLSGMVKAERTFISVLLPAPFSPRRPRIVPASATRLMPSFARTGPKDLWMSLSSTRIVPHRRGRDPWPPLAPAYLLDPSIPCRSLGMYQTCKSVATCPAFR